MEEDASLETSGVGDWGSRPWERSRRECVRSRPRSDADAEAGARAGRRGRDWWRRCWLHCSSHCPADWPCLGGAAGGSGDSVGPMPAEAAPAKASPPSLRLRSKRQARCRRAAPLRGWWSVQMPRPATLRGGPRGRAGGWLREAARQAQVRMPRWAVWRAKIPTATRWLMPTDAGRPAGQAPPRRATGAGSRNTGPVGRRRFPKAGDMKRSARVRTQHGLS